MINLPSNNKTYTQTNETDIGGASNSTVWSTRNINLFQGGVAKLSPRSIVLASEADDADIGLPRRIIYYNDDYFFATSQHLYSLDGELDEYGPVDRSDDSNGPSGVNDLVVFNNLLWAIEDSDIHTLDGATWTDQTISGLDAPGASEPDHVAVAVEHTQQVAISNNGNEVKLYNTSYTLDGTNQLTIPDDYQITCMAYSNKVLYIGTRHQEEGEAQVFTWDATGTGFDAVYPVGAGTVADIAAYGSTVVCLTSAGQLLQFNSGGFSQLANLPIYYSDRTYSPRVVNFSQLSKGSLSVDGNIIYIGVSSELEDSTKYLKDFNSGVWVYDPQVGLYHWGSFTGQKGYQDIVATTDVDTTDNEITVSAAPDTGSIAFYDASAGTVIGGIGDNQSYFVIKVDGTTIKLATSYDNAIAGTAIDLTGTGNSSQEFTFFPNGDMGVLTNDIRFPSVFVPAGVTQVPEREQGHSVIWMANDVDGTNTLLGAFAYPKENRGQITYPKIYSNSFKDKLSSIGIRYDGLFRNGTDKIVVKYRTSNKPALDWISASSDTIAQDLDITWSDGDTFTTTADISDVEDGDEVVFLNGTGAGYTAHVSGTPSESGGTYTVNIDEEFPFVSASDTASVVFNNFKKLATITDVNDDTWTESFNNITGPFVQIKLELRGQYTAVVDVLLNNTSWKELL